MKNVTRIGIIIAFLLVGFQSNATHWLGGEIVWTCNPVNGKFTFDVILYKECGTPAAGWVNSVNLTGGPTGSITCPALGPAVDISPTCVSVVGGPPATACVVTASGKGAVQRRVFRSAPITLNGTPPPGGWLFTWNSCCRPGTVRNGPTGNYYLRAIMYPYTPVGGATPNNTNPCYDNSPYFSETGSITICSGQPFVYNHLASDKDLDSLYMRFAAPWDGINQPVNFATGYSTTSPFPNPATSTLNGPISMNGLTGEVSMNIQSATEGSYASCFAVESWRCGQTNMGAAPVKIAEVFRDVAIVVLTGCTPNTEPGVLIDTVIFPNIKQHSAKSFSTNVYPGDTIEFDILATDYETQPDGITFQEIEFRSAGLQVNGNSPGLATGCDGVAPCATFTPIAPQTGYIRALNNKIKFFWVPNCQHLKVEGNFCSPFNTFTFSMRMQDDGCPAPRIALTTFRVNVIAGDPSPIEFECIDYRTATNDVRMSWNRAEIDSALTFNYYMLLGIQSNGTVDTLDRIYDIDSLNSVVSSGNHRSFYIIKSTGRCDFLSAPSDTLTIMDLTMTATPPGSAEYANLSWTALQTPLSYTTNGMYEIWIEAPRGSGNWNKVGETPNLNYIDTVQVCNTLVNYQIRVTDTVNGCQSTSTLDSATFSDKTNSDKMVLDSVSVNANGNSLISWQPSTSGDVVLYDVYYNDPVLGWAVIDQVPIGTVMPYEWATSSANERSEQFKVVSVDSCGNTSPNQVVVAHKTIYLRNYLNKCEGYSRVSWNNYEGFGEAVAGYRVYVQTTVGGTTNGWSLLNVSGKEDTSFVQNNLTNGTEYCYRVRAFDTTGTLSSTSNEICFTAQVPTPSKILYISQVTNDFGRGSLFINTLIDGNADVTGFDIERAPDILGPYEVIGQVDKPAFAPYTIGFNDYNTNPDRLHYYYRVSSQDSCGGRDTVSNIGRNIILSVKPKLNLTNVLNWNAYETWDGGVNKYEIYRKAADEVNYTFVSSTTDTTFTDNVKDYGETEGEFCYYVKAVEGINRWNLVQDDGQPFNSVSNQKCINQSARVYMPNAFRPGSSIAENRSFGPSIRFVEIEKYNFYIMNRWGVKVFETNDPEVRWDGKLDGEVAPQGVYIYVLKYSTPGEVPEEEKGSFTLIQ